MCGIAGFINHKKASVEDVNRVVRSMADSIRHRGPDDSGEWIDSEVGVALGHRRLAILELSNAGYQPMVSNSGRFVIVFNGEIYNHLEIREALPKNIISWRGHSDTETLLAAIDEWGLEKTLKACIGMFSLALWDRELRVMSLARDRIGEKPLYYGWQGDTFLFGSELKALRKHPSFRSEIDRSVLPLYLRHGYIPAPWSIWSGIKKLIPGTILQISKMQEIGGLPQPTVFWSLQEIISREKQNLFSGSDADAIQLMDQKLRGAITGQIVADVPVGAFLSGGIDSSTVVALMQSSSSKPINTFTIGFSEQDYNEAIHARAVAKHLGTDHTELYVAANQAQSIIPELNAIYDEPFADSSAIPTLLVSKLAKQKVTVSLSGDGGDELFGGYGHYFNDRAQTIWSALQSLPNPMGKLLSFALDSNVTQKLGLSLDSLKNNLSLNGGVISERVALISELLKAKTVDDYYREIITQWRPLPIAKHLKANSLSMPYHSAISDGLEIPTERMMAIDTLTYLPDDILVKVDRAAMAVSLETRVPLLDHRVIECAWSMPYKMKVRGGQTKWLLREVLYQYVPQKLVDRKKMGFGVPIDGWLRGPLREWAEDLLSEKNLAISGVFDIASIRKCWKRHLNNERNYRDPLWSILMFQDWYKKNLSSE